MKNFNQKDLFSLRITFFFPLACCCLAISACGGSDKKSTPAPNSAPTATNVTITDDNGGNALIGDNLTGSYVFSDTDDDAEGTSTLQWLRNGTAISAATSATYILVIADVDQTISFQVIPIASAGTTTGVAVASSNLSVLNSSPNANTVTITDDNGGDAVVSDTLTGSYTYSDADSDSEGTSTFRWLRNGVAIAGETNLTYTLTNDDVGQAVIFEVTPVATAGTISGTATSSSEVTSRFPTYSNFETADVVIGQADFMGNQANQGGSTAANTLWAPSGNTSVANDRLYIPDAGNRRLLGFNVIPTANNALADFVLGQLDFTSLGGGLSATEFDEPQSVAISNNKMFLTVSEQSRILIWNTVPTTGGVPADLVIGQPDLNSGSGACSSTGLTDPTTVWAVDDKVIVVDQDSNRVLIWNTTPTVNGAPADIVIGQQDFTHCGINDLDNDGSSDMPSAQTLFEPSGVWSDGTRLVVTDSSNNRVLIWNTFPTVNFAAADIVLGQSDFVNNMINDDNQDGIEDAGPSARTFSFPYIGVNSNGTQLFVSDLYNRRVLIWNTFPTTNFTPADVVLGQADFVHYTANDDNQDNVVDATPSARTLAGPAGIFQSGRQLFISDPGNSRVLIYNGQ